MPFQAPVSLFSLEAAIDDRPLTVSPVTSVAEAIAMMGKAQSSCSLPSLSLALNTVLMNQARASAVLVVEGTRLLGVFSEREAVQAIASGQDLSLLTVMDAIAQPAIRLQQSGDADTQDIFDALSLMRQHQLDHLPVVDLQENWVGLITPPSLRRVLQLDELLKSRQLAEMVTEPPLQAAIATSVCDLAQQMAEYQAECILLTSPSDDPQAVRVLTRQGVLQLQALGIDLRQLAGATVATAPLPCFPPSQLVLAAYWEMQQQRATRLAVVEPVGNVLSIVTPTSFLYRLDWAEMRQSTQQIQRSIREFESIRVSEQRQASVDKTDERQELRQQLQCSQLLSGMALRIRESLDLDTILQTSVNEVRQFLQCDRVIVYRFNPDMSGTVAVESVATGWRSALNSTIKDTCFAQNYAEAYKAGRTQIVEDIYTAGLTQCHIDILVFYDIRASLVVPILQGDNLWGLLCAYHCAEPRLWRSFEVNLLTQLATHMAIAIQQSELYQQAQSELKERNNTEAKLKVSLKEKESLLKEVHHRVKNNLQIISSLMRLQADYVKDEKSLALFKDSQNRIRSMALIHEKLYQSKDILRINFSDYIFDLTSNLLRSYTTGLQPNLHITVKDVFLNIDTAIPCGLIVNELVSNSLKHAFPNVQSDSAISIEIFSLGNHHFRLIVGDNGIGFPAEINFQDTDSLGLQLVCTFTEQLGGTIELETRGGTTFCITFTEV